MQYFQNNFVNFRLFVFALLVLALFLVVVFIILSQHISRIEFRLTGSHEKASHQL